VKVKRFVFSAVAVVHLLLADQIAKAAAVYFLAGQRPVTVIPYLLDFAYVENRGCAWGLLQGQVWPLAVFAIIALVFLFLKREAVFAPGKLGATTECLLWAGILGNLVDRVRLRCVIDFIDVHWGLSHFPCFNVADAYITIAAFLLVLCSFREKRSS